MPQPVQQIRSHPHYPLDPHSGYANHAPAYLHQPSFKHRCTELEPMQGMHCVPSCMNDAPPPLTYYVADVGPSGYNHSTFHQSHIPSMAGTGFDQSLNVQTSTDFYSPFPGRHEPNIGLSHSQCSLPLYYPSHT